METLFFRTAGYNQPMGELNWKALTSSTCVSTAAAVNL